MSPSLRSLTLAPVAALLLAVTGAQAGFLGGVKLENPIKVDPAKLNPTKFRPLPVDAGKFQHGAVPVALPARLPDPVDAAQNAKDKVIGGAPLRVVDHPELLKDKAQEATSGAQQAQTVAADLLKKGTDAASVVKVEDVSAVGERAANQAQKVVEAMHPERAEGVAGAMRGATSQMAVAVNQTSQRFAEFLNAFGPKASAVLSISGEAMACRFSGDCDSSSPSREAELPLDPTDPQDWLFWGFAFCLIVVACALCRVAFRCMYAAGRKGSVLLAEALIPLTESSAREPSLQLAETV